MNIKLKSSIIVISIILLIIGFNSYTFSANGSNEEINQKEQQIKELEQQIRDFQLMIDQKQGESSTLENEIAKLNAQINKVQLEVKRIQYSIDGVNENIVTINSEISVAEMTVELHRAALSEVIRVLNEKDQENLTHIILKNDNLSDFFTSLFNIEVTQDKLRVAIENIRNLKIGLEVNKEDLRDKRSELEQLQSIQEVEKRSIDSVKKQKNSILKETKGEEAKFQQLVKQTASNIEKIREQIYYLQQNGISVEDAIKFGQLAAIGAGIRPAYLLAVLEVESRMGQNVGSGNWYDDMYMCYVRLSEYYSNKRDYYLKRAENEKSAFIAITSKLGIDPYSVKVSAEPNYGCGGAMGPAQFIPTTWLSYERSVIQLTGHSIANPWNIEDAFTASAIKLARGGANKKTKASEIAASKAYLSGNSNCSSSICNYYANAIQTKAAQIEQGL